MTVAKDAEKLKLGKGAAFQKATLKRLPQQDEAWEADFQALPKPMGESETHYLGLVVTDDGDQPLAESRVEGRPSVNDLAALLAAAMKKPATGKPRRPERVRVRGHHQWRELFPHLAEFGIEVSVERELPAVLAVYQQHLLRERDARAAGATKPTTAQLAVEQLFPAITLWVNGYGHVEVGDQEGFGFVVRALDYGGLVFEDDRPATFAAALASLEAGLREWFRRERVEVPDGGSTDGD
jgi:hypothetical protein